MLAGLDLRGGGPDARSCCGLPRNSVDGQGGLDLRRAGGPILGAAAVCRETASTAKAAWTFGAPAARSSEPLQSAA